MGQFKQAIEIYKLDKWNMMMVEIIGTKYTVREISTQWGEDTHTFLSRHALLQFAEQRFAGEFDAGEAERQRILSLFRDICR
jgi:hypothetical protein